MILLSDRDSIADKKRSWCRGLCTLQKLTGHRQDCAAVETVRQDCAAVETVVNKCH